ncbi:hypothetical protein DR950_19660 [Kitasatospora xanthocidica]|uniref:Uncharacterized protein n=1 Tax=Kitasatospora xanthocidica TaxID=83382 RepID=A0A372ZVD0_9ACTN|nr:hypothetical protein DR950_19660 [Kitasatospora xanthocidica]
MAETGSAARRSRSASRSCSARTARVRWWVRVAARACAATASSGSASPGPGSDGPSPVGPLSVGPLSVRPLPVGPLSVGLSPVGPSPVGPSPDGPSPVAPPRGRSAAAPSGSWPFSAPRSRKTEARKPGRGNWTVAVPSDWPSAEYCIGRRSPMLVRRLPGAIGEPVGPPLPDIVPRTGAAVSQAAQLVRVLVRCRPM